MSKVKMLVKLIVIFFIIYQPKNMFHERVFGFQTVEKLVSDRKSIQPATNLYHVTQKVE